MISTGEQVRKLHFVGVTDDHSGLLFVDGQDTAGERYSVPVDEALYGVLEELRRARRPRRPRLAVDGSNDRRVDHRVVANGAVDSGGVDNGAVDNGAVDQDHRPTFPGDRPSFATLTPREIQGRLRAGRSMADVATEAGVDVAWVERFAAPILAEQHSAVTRAGRMVFLAPRRGPSARPLAESVRRNLLVKEIRMVDDDLAACWSAFRHDGREWVIRFIYRFRGRDVEAEWLADMHAGSLVALNRPATLLGYVAPPAAGGPDLEAIGLTVRASTRPARVGSRHAQSEAAAAPPPLF